MRAAILISGYLRSFKINLDNIKSKILDRFNNYDIYIHITENEETEDRYLNKSNENLLEKIKETLNPKVLLVEPNILFSTDPQKNILYNQWIKFYKLNEIKKTNELFSSKYDIVVKLRPDLHLLSDVNFDICNQENIVYVPKDSKIDRSKLSNYNDNFLCDTFAFGKSKVMDLYFKIFENLDILTEEYGFTPETVIYEYLNKNLKIEKFYLDYYIILSTCNVFAICGDSGSGKTTLGNLLKKYFNSSFLLECDRYHKWERNDENWSKFTHLNPEANFLTKMSEDIFDLKIGRSIYSVDYDHKNGKFTQKQKIENSKNLIVCGLHSLYDKSDSLYDLKIFMDTDPNLKKKWKIKRDLEKRNYTVKTILEQIERRKEDYYRYIEPQIRNSHVIVNFYESSFGEIGLKIKLHKNLELKFILDVIEKKFIDVLKTCENDFVCLDFNRYYDNEQLKNLKFRTFDFYDYVIYILLNLKK